MLAREIGSMVENEGTRKPEETNDVLPKEFHYLLSRDLGERHRLYLLGEVIGGYRRNLNWGRARGRRPTTSSPHCMKSQGSVECEGLHSTC